ncbi:MAG: Holliday junction resolvase RuvX [Planctomycetaceae bacterium]|nr:Holliday junction resolvase RuvX [Planctomycetaceae bacterium]
MILLGVDLGDRRVGFAVTDEAELLAVPSGFAKVSNLAEAVDAVRGKAEAESAGLVVLGNPINMDGRPGPKAREAAAFADMLREEGLEVELWDERLTTSEATRLLRAAGHDRKRRTTLIDANAAQRLLESFVQARRRRG